MATYSELANINSLPGWDTFTDKVYTATAKKAQIVIDTPTPPASRLEWAKNAIKSPRSAANELIVYIVVANDTATTTQILNATDNAIQTNINNAVDAIYST